MILLVASYDILLGYAGIVSFAHVMFFGVGAYGVGLALYAFGASWMAVLSRARRGRRAARSRSRSRSGCSRCACRRSSSPW